MFSRTHLRRALLGAALTAPLLLSAQAVAGQQFTEALAWNGNDSGGSGMSLEADGISVRARRGVNVTAGTFIARSYCRPESDGTTIRSVHVNFFRWHTTPGAPAAQFKIVDEDNATLFSNGDSAVEQTTDGNPKPMEGKRTGADVRCVKALVTQTGEGADADRGRLWSIIPVNYTFEDIQPPVISKPTISAPVKPPVEVAGKKWFRAQDQRGCEEEEKPEKECPVTVDVNWTSLDNAYDRGTIGVKVDEGKGFAQDFGDQADRQHKAGAVPVGATGQHKITVYRTSGQSGTASQSETVWADGWRPVIKPTASEYVRSSDSARLSWSVTEKGSGIDRSWAEIIINNSSFLTLGKVQGASSSVAQLAKVPDNVADGTYPVLIRAVDKVGYRTTIRATPLVIARSQAAQQAAQQATKPTAGAVAASGGAKARRANGIVNAWFPGEKTKIRVAQAKRGTTVTGRVTTAGAPEANSPVAINVGTRIIRTRTNDSGVFRASIRVARPAAVGVMAFGGSASTVLNVVK